MLHVNYIKLFGALSAFVLTLGGCGFDPLYESNKTSIQVQQKLSRIEVAQIPDRPGQILRNALESKFTRGVKPALPDYLLEAHLTAEKSGTTLRKDGTTSRYRLGRTVNFKLKDTATGKVVYEDSLTQNASYAVGDTTAIGAFASTIGEKDTDTRLIELLADEMALLISSYLAHEKAS